jgi:hypothetical protein
MDETGQLPLTTDLVNPMHKLSDAHESIAEVMLVALLPQQPTDQNDY